MNLKVHNVKGTGEREGHKKRERVKEWLFILPGRFISSVLPAHTLSLSLGALRRTRHFQSTSKVKFQQFIVVLLDCGNLCVVVNLQPKEALAWPDSCLRQECQRLEFDSNTHTQSVRTERNGGEEDWSLTVFKISKVYDIDTALHANI